MRIVMRTRGNVQSLRSIGRLRRSPYICSDCRRNASQSSSATVWKTRQGSANILQQRTPTSIALAGNGAVRRISNSRRRPDRNDVQSPGIDDEDTVAAPPFAQRARQHKAGYSAEVVPPQIESKDLPTREDIRSRLRKWSEEQSRLAIASGDTVPIFGALPPNNSLLLEDAEPQEEDEDFERHDDNINEEDDNLYARNPLGLEPGDVFRSNLKGINHQFAVFLGLRQHRKALVLLADGRWAMGLNSYPNTVILPNFSNVEETNFLRSCILEHPNLRKAEEADPTYQSQDSVLGDLPVALTRSLTRRLSSLSEEIIAFQRQNTATLDGLYSKFAHEDKFVSHRFDMIVKVLLGKDLAELSMGARYAIFAMLRKNEGKHTIMRNKSTNVEVFFTPKTLYKQILDVTRWARQYQDCAARAAVGHDMSAELRANPLNSFISKARRIILKSRKLRSPTTIGSLGPSSENKIQADGSVMTRDTEEILSPEDQSIIEFMWCTYLRQPHAYHDVSARSVGSLILRAIGAYPKMQLNLQIARLFFREMGLMAPWSEEMDHDLRIPAPGRRGVPGAQKLIRDTDELARTKGFTSDSFNIPLEDHMATLRKNWGSAEVYCIDNPSTSVLDDGISLEDSTNVPGATWVHVHVAHPSAFLDPKGEFAQRARTLTAAIYTSAKLYGMLPEDMLHAMSLRPNAAVMTVSSLILQDGEVADIKVTVGTIQKIVRLEPAAVDAVLGKEPVEEAVLQVGPTVTKSKKFDMSDYQTAEMHTDFIRKLDSLIKVRTKKRREEFPDYPRWPILVPRINDHVSWTEIFDGSRHTRSYHYLGDPTIRIISPRNQVVRRWDENWDLQQDLTAQTMVLAGESIGRWLKERKIPAVFNGAVPVDEENSVPLINEMVVDSPIRHLLPRKLVSSRPVTHTLLGVAQYVRMTSPLRRYSDCVAQWQVDAYLKAEAKGPLAAPGVNARDLLPFTSTEIDRYIEEGGDTTQGLEMLKRKATHHWNMQAIFRAFHFNEAPLPAIWDAQITQANLRVPQKSDHYQEAPDIADLVAFLQPFSLRTLIIKSAEGWEVGVKRFQYLPVKIEYVDTTGASVYVKAVGPPSWTATQTGPLRCVKPENEAKVP